MVLKEEGVEAVDGFLFDLGMSMLQLKGPRGFSFQRDEPLDMRIDPEDRLTAFDVINKYSEKDLERILKEYGEEKKARAIAKAIVLQRSKKPIETTGELVDVVLSVVKKKRKNPSSHKGLSSNKDRSKQRVGAFKGCPLESSPLSQKGREAGGNILPLLGGQDR